MAYARLEPFGALREDMRAGVIAATIANVHSGKKGKRFDPMDFVLSPLARAETSATPADQVRAAFSRFPGGDAAGRPRFAEGRKR